jgi:hypothetical protein
MYHWMQASASNQLLQIDSSIRILLAHPQYKSHQTLISCFLRTRPAVYLKVDTLLHSVKDLDVELQIAYETHYVPQSQYRTFSVILDATVSIEPQILIEFFQKYLQQTAEGMLLYCSRNYLDLVERFPEIKAVTKLWPISNEWMLIDYLQRDHDRQLVEVYALGSGRAIVNGNMIADWEGEILKKLFFYLIDRELQTRQQIFEAIWPSLAVREATNLFHVSKRKLNDVLKFDLMVFGGGYYRLSHTIDLHYDVSTYITTLQESAVSQSHKNVSLLKRCAAMYRGDFLTGLEGDWVQIRREELRRTQAEILANLDTSNHLRENEIGQHSRYSR